MAIALTELILIVFLLVIMFTVHRHGPWAVAKGVLALLLMLALAAIPLALLSYSRTSSEPAAAVAMDHAMVFEAPAVGTVPLQSAPMLHQDQQFAIEAEAEPNGAASYEVIPIDDEKPAPLSADGKVVGDTEVWADSFDAEHIADLYSSRIEAVRSIARQCGARLKDLEKVGDLEANFKIGPRLSVSRGDEVTNVFKRELRMAVPGIRIVSQEHEEAVSMMLEFQGHESVGDMHVLNLELVLANEVFNIDARYVNKNWVRNDVRFRLSDKAPRRYLVVLGSSKHGESAIELAANELISDVDYYFTHRARGRYGYNSNEFPDLARVAAIALTRDKFVQNFRTKVDGSRAQNPMTREAILIDCTLEELYSAIGSTKTGNPYVHPDDRSTRTVMYTSGHQRRGGPQADGFALMAAVLLGCCGVLKGVGWFFDRKSLRP